MAKCNNLRSWALKGYDERGKGRTMSTKSPESEHNDREELDDLFG